MLAQLNKEACEIAALYYWPEYPDILTDLSQGCVPAGFGRLVGENIALFSNHWPFGASVDELEEDRIHAKRLARLRLLVAKMNIYNRGKHANQEENQCSQ